jgi:hypothetical protein
VRRHEEVEAVRRHEEAVIRHEEAEAVRRHEIEIKRLELEILKETTNKTTERPTSYNSVRLPKLELEHFDGNVFQ